MRSFDMSNTCIKWGTAFNINLGTIGRWGTERYRHTDKWRFLITSPKYQHYDSRDFGTKEELDTAILEWICLAKG